MNHAPLTIKTFVDASFGENAYVVSTDFAPVGRTGWIIDPSFAPQTRRLLGYVREEAIQIERIVLTHGHLDHIAGVDIVREAHPQARVSMPKGEWAALSDANVNLSAMMGLPIVLKTRADDDLAVDASLTLGRTNWQVLDVSGHSPAGRALYCATAGVVFSGDALFSAGIGRSDFPGSDGDLLVENIRHRLLSLPDVTVVYSGHGPPTTIGNERKFNPFLAE